MDFITAQGWNILTPSVDKTLSHIIYQLCLSLMVFLSFKWFKSPLFQVKIGILKGTDNQARLHDHWGLLLFILSPAVFFFLWFLPPPSHPLTLRHLSKVPSQFSNPFVWWELSEFKC